MASARRLAATIGVVAALTGCPASKAPPASSGDGVEDPKTPTKAETKSDAEETPVAFELKTEELDYEVDGVKLKGYLAYDGSKTDPRPGVLVVHEWWGHNDYARKRADMLAELGYTALALDMYGDGKQADHPEDAKKFMMEVMSDLDTGVARFQAAQALLEQHATTDPEKTAAIGYCFGGAVVLHMARTGLDLDGVASFHGNLSTKTPAEKGKVGAKVLVLHGADDPFVAAEDLAAFKQEMADAGVDMRLVAYPGAKHAFTNPAATELGTKFELPLAYDEDADAKSWTELEGFLAKLFG